MFGVMTLIRKVYVEVNVLFDIDGRMTPKSILYDDGKTYIIDKVIDKRQAASMAAGGQGIRYTVEIGGKETFLFYEKYRGFVKGKR